MPNTPLNKEELRKWFDENLLSDRYTHDKKCGVTETRDYGNCDCMKVELFDKLAKLLLADRDAAVREARENELGLTLDGILGDTWSHSNPGSEEEFFRIHVEHVVHYLNARRSALQSQPNAKEDSDENI